MMWLTEKKIAFIALIALVFLPGLIVGLPGYAQDTPVTKDISDSFAVIDTTFDCKTNTSNSPVCSESDTGLPARVLPRSYSRLYRSNEVDSSAILPFTVPAFLPLYVFNQQAGTSHRIKVDGWYQVGVDRDKPVGWIQAKDAIQWKQALVVSYTHPGDKIEGRKPIIMFKDIYALNNLLASDDIASHAQTIYQRIENGEQVDSVVSKEPENFVDIRRQPYIIPITAFEQREIEGEEVTLLEISAAVPNFRGEDTIGNADYMKIANTPRGRGIKPFSGQPPEPVNQPTDPCGSPAQTSKLSTGEDIDDNRLPTLDVVFVVDTTLSMQPFIDETRHVIEAMSSKIEETLPEIVKFGLVGYRDSTTYMPKIGYVAKNFTDQFVNARELGDLLGHLKSTRVNSDDEAEEVFAGIETAINANWRSDSLKLIVLIGDASGHDYDHPYNTTGKNHEDIKRELLTNQIQLMAVHLQSNRKAAVQDRAVAIEQYERLAQGNAINSGTAMVDISATDKENFYYQMYNFANSISRGFYNATERMKRNQSIDNVAEYNVDSGCANEPFPDIKMPNSVSSETSNQMLGATNMVLQNALIEYIGQTAYPPKDITAWVSDRDLTDLSIKSLQVHVLLTKEQLSTLAQSLERLLEALKKADSSQQQFFTALQELAGQTLKRPEDIASAGKLSETGLLPLFINGLPYKSDVLNLNNDMFASMTSTQRVRLQARLNAKIKQYQEIVASPDLWIPMNQSDSGDFSVYPLPLDYLP